MTANRDMGLRLRVAIHLLASDQGGRTGPVIDGYRPLCRIERSDGDDRIIDLAELRLKQEILPGGSGEGTLEFAQKVSDLAGSLLPVGAVISLAEGANVVGQAEVLEVV